MQASTFVGSKLSSSGFLSGQRLQQRVAAPQVRSRGASGLPPGLWQGSGVAGGAPHAAPLVAPGH